MRLKNTFPIQEEDLPGTDAQYLDWIRTLPSCISGGYSEQVNGQWRNPACHVRRANTFGTGYKARFSAIPCTHLEHHAQTVYGEMECLIRHHPDGIDIVRKMGAKSWFDNQLKHYRELWKQRINLSV